MRHQTQDEEDDHADRALCRWAFALALLSMLGVGAREAVTLLSNPLSAASSQSAPATPGAIP